MDVGAIGWWNYDNQGDLAMLATLCQGLAPHRVVPVEIGFPAHQDATYRLNRLDYVILGGGTLIAGKPAAPFDTFDQWGDQLECPLGVVGLGVDPILEQSWPAIEALIDRARFFFVRDRASHALLRNHPKVQIMPDLTFARPLPANEYDPGLAGVTPVCGVNLRRHPGLDPQPWLEAIAHLPVKVKGIPFSTLSYWAERGLLQQLDPECPERFDAALYRQIDLFIGTAFHSTLFAVQAAVPLIAIDYAPKVRHFMEDIGLTRYLLSPGEHHRLPGLVDDMCAHHSEIVRDLRAIRERLRQDAQRSLETVREQVEQSGRRHGRSGPKVTIMIMGAGHAEKDERTLASCTSQTYENVEILFSAPNPVQALPDTADAARVRYISADAQAGAGPRLCQMLAQSGGEYLTWVDGGDCFTRDAMDCLISRLEGDRHLDMVYADYYLVNEAYLPVSRNAVLGPEKLFRRDVVGPCFLLRRTLLARMGQPAAETPLVGYDLWLRAIPGCPFYPFQTPLFYSARQIKSPAFIEQERAVRRNWRRARPAWQRAAWRALDTDFGERFIVQPAVHTLNLLKGLIHA